MPEDARDGGAVFGWSYLDRSGQEIGVSHRFDDAEAAEEWLSGCWPDLIANGVEEVVLHDHANGRRVYRMELGQA